MTDRNINEIWERIIAHEGQEFKQKGGKVFTYTIKGDALKPYLIEKPSTPNQNIGKNEFAKSLPCLPFDGPGKISDCVRGPSYVYGILMDKRISQGDW